LIGQRKGKVKKMLKPYTKRKKKESIMLGFLWRIGLHFLRCLSKTPCVFLFKRLQSPGCHIAHMDGSPAGLILFSLQDQVADRANKPPVRWLGTHYIPKIRDVPAGEESRTW